VPALAVPDDAALRAFSGAARTLGFVGFNVTMPHKQAVMELCDEVGALVASPERKLCTASMAV
jgi:shikimate 5-dehydrogenase